MSKPYVADVELFRGSDVVGKMSSFRMMPDDRYLRISQTVTAAPATTTRWYVSGPPGLCRITCERLPNAGGHNHAGGPSGVAQPSTFQLGPNIPQNFPYDFRTPVVGGMIKLIATFSDGSTDVDFVDVRVSGLVPLASSTAVVLVGSTVVHPSNHFGTPSLVQKIQHVAALFYQKYSAPIYVNDMSLETGGLFDIGGNWASPHQTHRDGRNADVRSTTMSAEQKDFFRSTATSAGLAVVLENEGAANEHWHLTG